LLSQRRTLQLEPKAGPAAVPVLRSHSTLVRLDDRLDNGQSQTDALAPLRGQAPSIEGLKELFRTALWDSWPSISNRDPHIPLPSGKPDAHRQATVGELAGIGDEIQQNLHYSTSVGRYAGKRLAPAYL
jgi:hypothetical protein